ncbi:polyprotein [kunsagivirus A1]|uniref:Genome polyprotein n=1 Tax=kunsagivirus A1 TaxID=2847817 RepID=S4VD62_9PICO|nr:polyprotein [Kunsagivirus A]AGO59796.1 polyprotein [kunsagivirus A1]
MDPLSLTAGLVGDVVGGVAGAITGGGDPVGSLLSSGLSLLGLGSSSSTSSPTPSRDGGGPSSIGPQLSAPDLPQPPPSPGLPLSAGGDPQPHGVTSSEPPTPAPTHTQAGSSQSTATPFGGASSGHTPTFEDACFANCLAPDAQASLTGKLTRVSTFGYSNSARSFASINVVHLPRNYYVTYTQAPPHGSALFMRLVRTRFLVEIQSSAPLGAAGIVVFYFAPADIPESEGHMGSSVFNLSPCDFDVARMSTAKFVIPYAATTPFVPVDSHDMGRFVCMALTPYRAPSGAQSELTFTIYMAAIESELTCPRPRRQMFSTHSQLQEVVITSTPGSLTIGNSSLANLAPTLSLAGEGYRIDEITPGGQRPVDDFIWLALRPSTRYEGWSFDWHPTDPAEAQLFAWDLDLGMSTSNLGILANSFAYARGSLQITLVAALSVFNRGRLRLCFEMAGDDRYDHQASMAVNFTVIDFSNSNTGSLVVPYTSPSWFRPTTADHWGRIVVFVNTPLTASAACIDVVSVQVFVSFAPDCKFYVPHSNGMTYQAPPMPDQVSATQCSDPFGPQVTVVDFSQPLVAAETSPSPHAMFSSAHTNVRHLLGRFWHLTDEFEATHVLSSHPIPFPANSHAAIARSCAFWNGEPVFVVINHTAGPIEVSHFWEDAYVAVTHALSSRGSILIPSKGQAVFSVPFYSPTPVRSTDANASLGNLLVRTLETAVSGRFSVFVAIRNPKLFFPRAIPDWVIPGRSVARTYRSALAALTGAASARATTSRESVARIMAAAAALQGPGCFPFGRHSAPVSHSSVASSPRSLLHFLIGRPRPRVPPSPSLLLSGDVEPNPGPVTMVYDPIECKYYLEVGGHLLGMNPPRGWPAKTKINKKVNTTCRYPKTHKCPRWSLFIAQRQPWFISGPIVWDWIMVDYFPLSPEAILCSHGICQIENDDVHLLMDGVFLPLSRLARMDCAGLISWLFLKMPTWFHCFPFSRPSCPVYLPPEARAGVTMTAIPQGPFDTILSFFDGYLMKSAFRHYTPVVLRCIITLYSIHVANDPIVTLLLGGLATYDIMVTKPPAALVVIIDAVSCATYDSFKAVMAPVFGDITATAWRRIKEKFLRLCARAQDFKKTTDTAKAVVWWISSIAKMMHYVWINWLNPPVQNRQVQLAVAQLLVDCNAFLSDLSLDPSTLGDRPRRQRLLVYLQRALQMPGNPDNVQRLLQQSFNKLVSLSPIPPSPPSTRVEPVGVWLSGEPGTGKSLLMSALSADIAKHYNWTVYNHPTGSDYFDLYTNQQVHCIDDLGQGKAEEDLKVLCQCISTVPFVVPGAAIEDKKHYYNGKVVIATTNRTDFRTYTLTTPGALERRFPIRVRVLQSKWPLTKETLRDRTYFNLVSASEAAHPITYSCLLDSIIQAYDSRLALLQGPPSPNPFHLLADPTFPPPPPEDEPQSCDDDHLAAIEALEVTPDSNDQKWLEAVGGSQAADPDLPMLSSAPADPSLLERVTALADRLYGSLRKRTVPEWALMAFGSLGLFAVLAGIVRKIFSFLQPRPTPPQGPYNPATAGVRISARELARRADPQSPWQPQFNHCFKNCVFIEADGFTWYAVMFGRVLVVNKHYLDCWSGPVVVSTAVSSFSADLTVPPQFVEGDLAYFHLPSAPPLKAAPKHYTVPEPASGTQAMLLYAGRDGTYAVTTHTNSYYTFTNGSFFCGIVPSVHSYEVPTQAGMCGGLLVLQVGGNWIPYAVHFAGLPHRGYAQGLNLDWIAAVNAPAHPLPPLPDDALPAPQGIITKIEPTSNFRLGFCPYTKYSPSPVSLVIRSELEPAVLSAHDNRLEVKRESNAMFLLEKTQKYDTNVTVPRPLLLQTLATEYGTHLRNLMSTLASPASIEEAVFDTVCPMDHRASAGPHYPGVKRSELIDFQRRTISDRLREDVVALRAAFARGDNVYLPFSSFLKDELRPKPKVRNGDTRVVECSSLHYTVAFRMQFLSVLRMMYGSDPNQTGLAPGMNVYLEFSTMVSNLYPNNLCLDFKKYDSRLPSDVMSVAADLFASLTEDPVVSRRYFDPIIDSIHEVGPYRVEVHGGMPSGCAVTTLLNSVCNVLMCSYAVLLQDPDMDFQVVAYGDDNIVSTAEPLDVPAFRSVLASDFGMVTTSADKSEECYQVPPEQVDFLKRRLRWTSDFPVPVPVLPLDSMLSRLCWCKGPHEFRDQLISFSYELGFYGQEVYHRVFSALLPHATLPPWSQTLQSCRYLLGIEDALHPAGKT